MAEHAGTWSVALARGREGDAKHARHDRGTDLADAVARVPEVEAVLHRPDGARGRKGRLLEAVLLAAQGGDLIIELGPVHARIRQSGTERVRQALASQRLLRFDRRAFTPETDSQAPKLRRAGRRGR